MKREIVFLTHRSPQLRTLTAVVSASLVLGFQPIVVGMLRESSGEKAHLNVKQRDLEDFGVGFENLRTLGLHVNRPSETSINFQNVVAYVSIDSPSIYAELNLPRRPWIQLQYGAGDLYYSVARAKIRADAFGIWGENWIDERFMEHNLFPNELSSAMNYVSTRPTAVVGNVSLPDWTVASKAQESLPKKVTYFEPHILAKSRNAVRDVLAPVRFSMRYAAQRKSIARQLQNIDNAVTLLGFEKIYRRRDKTLVAPLGQQGFLAPQSRRDQLDDIQDSALIVSFTPSVSAVEALWYGRKVFQLDSRLVIDSRHDNYRTPNHLMHYDLRNRNPNFLIATNPAAHVSELSDWISDRSEGGGLPDLEGWCDRDINLPEALDFLINQTRKA